MIEVRDLCKRFGAVDVLSELTLSVAQGTVAAVIGPSGGGKSTFLRCINGLESFERGEVRVGSDVLVWNGSPRERADRLRAIRRKVGFVFQQFNLFPHLDVIGNVSEAPLRVLGHARAAAEAEAVRLLDRVGLAEKKDAYPHELSGGQQQRVAIARALAMHPEVLLLDEPTSALDPVMAAEVMSVISELARAGQTMIVVTHQLGLVRAIADTVHVFAAGRRVEHGPTAAVFENPAHDTTRAFLRKLQAW
ncbi:MAG TPA: amino acid ABC transporter ATP-binding protein [Polyangiaceae bacterium]|nr:amino acid ABC transporter ATP-binding protein [Polyangiaceae bacterium]